MSGAPVDRAARDQARDDHGTSLVLEAGAGTGKTTLLIDRIEALVRTGHARLEDLAAVTFTENAATTMKLRLRERLERARADAAVPEDERRRASDALDVLERAQVSTIHALCAAILAERPLECGVVPGFRTADEAEADMLFAAAWDEWLSEQLVKGDDVLLEALDAEIPLEALGRFGERTSLRGFARALIEQRDLRPLVAEAPEDPRAWHRELEAHAARARAVLALAPHGDTLTCRLEDLLAFADHPDVAGPADTARRLLKMPAIPGNVKGNKARWPRADILEEARAIADWSRRALTEWKAAHGAALHGRIMAALSGVGERYARLKAERGVLDFLDLLLKARDALRDRESVRRYFRERFRLLIIDEFQDTDPLQVEIARLLAGEAPGALVVVGDAKQSIYRFRRADVDLFRRLSAQAAARPGHQVLHLTQNFRSRPAILRFVNRAFGVLIQESKEADQPPYEAIDPPPGLSEEPSVIALRFEAPHYAESADLLRAESVALAAVIAQVAAGRDDVRDPATGATRKSRAGDVMVLARRLTQVRYLEEALEAAGLRFAVEGGKSFFDRQEVHETLAVLRAVEDPTDRVSLVAALRSSFFGVSDRDIVSYALAGGPLWIGPVDEAKPAAEALGPAMALLDDLHRRRTRDSVPAILEVLYDETRVLAALTGTRRGEAQIANLEKVASLARQAAELGVLTLRGFAELLQARILEASEEPDLPSTRPGDPHTVRILSIHKAKGLEAPVVVLFDSADNFQLSTESVALWEEGKIALGFRAGCQPPGWDTLVTADKKKAWAEGHRLKYVACTRARDLLVVPVPPPDARPGAFWRELTQFLPKASDADVQVVDAGTLPAPLRETDDTDFRALAGAGGGDAVAARWDAERRHRIDEAAQRRFVPISATRAAARSAPPAAVAAISGGGRDFGGLVHRILEWIPLEPDGAPGLAVTMAAALAPTFGLDAEGGRRAGEAAQRALDLPVMHRARRAERLWRELPVWFPEGEDLVEGVVDLVFEEDDGLVIVDYKTDHIGEDQVLAQAAHHAPQLQLYGRGLAQATGLPVRERLVLFTALGRTVPV